MKSDETWMKEIRRTGWLNTEDSVTMNKSEIRAIQADALREAAKLCREHGYIHDSHEDVAKNIESLAQTIEQKGQG